MNSPPSSRPQEPAALLTIKQVAELLGCSQRHVRRLADRGEMPPPVRLGALVRWDRAGIEQWIKAGCPDCRKGAKP